MILPRTTLDEAETLAERIRSSVAVLDPGHPDLHVTMSIGVSAFPESAKDSDGVLGAADAALLRAKSGGRNRVCLYTDVIADATAQLEGELAAVGRRFAAFIGLSEAEAAGLVTALPCMRPAPPSRTRCRRSSARQTGAAESTRCGRAPWRRSCTATSAGTAAIEGRRGVEIPRVARAFAVCRRWDPAAHNGDSVADLRSRARTS
jgi:hypothetical protein